MSIKYALKINLTLDELAALEEDGWEVVRHLMIKPGEMGQRLEEDPRVDVLLRRDDWIPAEEPRRRKTRAQARLNP